MTVSKFPGRIDPDPAAATPPEEEAAESTSGPALAGVPGAVTRPPRRWWQRRTATGDPRPLIDGQDLERLTEGLYRIGSRFRQPSPQESRLRAQISVVTRELEVLAATKAERRRPWAVSAAALLGDARTALESGQVIDGWQLVRAAERHMIEARQVEELGDDLTVTKRRLDELSPGMAAQLPQRRTKDPEELRSALRRAQALLDAYLDEFERLVHQKARMLGHGAILLAGMVVLVGLAVLFDLPVDVGGTVLSGFGTYVTIVGLGMAGAIVSRAIAGESDQGYVVQASMNPMLVHLLRIGLGGAAALFVLLYLQSGIQGLIDATGINAYPFALAAGFGERIIDRVFARTQQSCAETASRMVGIEDV